MESDLTKFYSSWSFKPDWVIEFDNEAAGRKVMRVLSGMPSLYELGITSMVDFGCGYGKSLRDMFDRMQLKQAYGFDFSSQAIKYANQNFVKSGLEYRQLPSLDIAENMEIMKSVIGERADAILLFDLLEHVPDCNNLIINLSQIAKYFIIILPIEENMINNYCVKKIYPSTKHYNGHLREFNVNSVHYFIRKLGLTPISEGVCIYDFKDSYPPQSLRPLTFRIVARVLLKYIRMLLSKVLPKKIYIRLVGPGTYFCVSTFNRDHILSP